MLKSKKCSWSVTLTKIYLQFHFFPHFHICLDFEPRNKLLYLEHFFPKNLLKSKNHCNCLTFTTAA